MRLRRRWGYTGADEYRGLRSGSKLVMTHKGQAFELAFKHRMLDAGPEVYRACDSLQQAISRLYRQAGIVSVIAQRQALACCKNPSRDWRCRDSTDDPRTRLDNSKPYLSVDQVVIRRAFEVAL
ncbi:Site-specific recombinase, phage integrase family (fragment) [Pseudomonas veronii]